MNNANYTTIIRWVEELLPSAFTVVKAERPGSATAGDAPRPARPYCAVAIQSTEAVGEDDEQMREKGDPAGDELVDVTGERRAVVRFTIAADDANARIEDFRQAIRKQWTLDHFYSSGIAVEGIERAISVPRVRNLRHRPRARVEISYRYPETYTDDRGIIEEIGFEWSVGNITESDTFET